MRGPDTPARRGPSAGVARERGDLRLEQAAQAAALAREDGEPERCARARVEVRGEAADADAVRPCVSAEHYVRLR